MPTMGRRPSVNMNLPARLRARVRGDVTYYFYDAGGKPRKELALGTDYVQAIKKWGELEADTSPKHHQLVTLMYAWEKYLQSNKFQALADRTQKDYLAQIKWIMKIFNDPPAAMIAIRTVDIQQYMNWRGKVAPVRANRERALISTIWNFARNEGITDATNPCAGVDGFTETGRDVYTEDAVYDAIYDCADRVTRDAMDLAYGCGQRPSDTLKMSETDIKGNTIEIVQGKTKHKLRINIVGQLKKTIDRIREMKKGLKVHSLALICKDSGAALGYWGLRQRIDAARLAAVKKYPKLEAEIKQFQFRDLRAKSGTDKTDQEGLQQAQKLLGHSNQKTTEIYVRRRKGETVDPTE